MFLPTRPQQRRSGSGNGSQRRGGGVCALPPAPEPTDADAKPAADAAPPATGLAGFGKAILENRRVIAVAVAIADVAFLWVAIKLGKNWWDGRG